MYKKEKIFFRESRHIEDIERTSLEVENKDEWRKIRERMKTVSVALVFCINIGVDPPDIERPYPCARKQAWINPNNSNPQKSAKKIANNLQKIYEKLQPRARYKHVIDPTVEIVKKLCINLRKNAKNERVLFHYNGHGVPKPTDSGEIWVFNKNITQYIPLSLFDLQSWMGVPSVYLWDCNSAGTIVNKFLLLADDHSVRWLDECRSYKNDNYPSPIIKEDSYENLDSHIPKITSMPSFKESIQLGACAADETLPFNPELPADLFTSCLTTPIQTSFLCHMLKTGTKNRFPPNIIEQIPGFPNDRKTLLGELNWIFAALTDTIAWSSLPMETFQKLFRQDLLIASLFRSFLLAERIMFENGCHVVSQPKLPSVHSHPFWEYWDHTLDLCLNYMYNLIADKGNIIQLNQNWFVPTSMKHNLLVELSCNGAENESLFSNFFIEQLQAFEVWLMFGIDKKSPPQQLPVLLQVLLSQTHRVRALELLAKFVDLGSWAVVSALSVGIFPYVLKLLQCFNKELRPALAFIWAKILSIDPVNQNELIKDNGYLYFTNILKDQEVEPRFKIVPAFVMAMLIYNNYRPAQEKLIQSDYINECITLLSDSSAIKCRMLCLWLLIGLGRLWVEYDKARWLAVRNVTYERVGEFLDDDVPEVRAAAVYALGCFFHNRSRTNDHATTIDNEICDKLCDKCSYDGSVLVRAELAAAIQWLLIDFESRFLDICIEIDKKIEKNLTIPPNNKKASLTPLQSDENIPFLNNFVIKNSLSSIINSKKREKDNLNSTKKNSISGTATTTPTGNKKSFSDSKEEYKLKIFEQMCFLESRSFKDPFERIWLVLLRLCFDPFEQVSNMCMKLILHIFELLEKKKLQKNMVHLNRNQSLSDSVSSDNTTRKNVLFSIGSPSVISNTLTSQTDPVFRRFSTHNESGYDCSLSDMVSNGIIETSSTTFTPKRSIFGSQFSRYSRSNQLNSDDDIFYTYPTEIVSTKFVEWCSKTFTQPIYKTIYEDVNTSTKTSLVDNTKSYTVANSTDWALHTYEGLKQKLGSEIELINSNKTRFDFHCMNFKAEKTISSLVWSYLRPYLYVCDGTTVYLYNFRESHPKPSCKFIAYNQSLIKDSISDMIVINELTHELLITGTSNGLLEVWDPMFSEHSHEIQSKPKLVTAAYLLSDLSRISSNNLKNNHTIYQWDQSFGRIACSGNVKVCRLWDAWAEKNVLDLKSKSKNYFFKNNYATCISMDLSCNLISCGFVDGSFNVYDVRLPPDSNEIINQRDFLVPIIGSSLLSNDQRLIIGSKDGEIKVWEQRMYKKSIVKFNTIEKVDSSQQKYNKDIAMEFMDVQKSGEIISCTFNNSNIRMFDTYGKKCITQISQSHKNQNGIKYSHSNNLNCILEPTAMRFHQGQMLVGLATNDNFVMAYGLSGTF